MHRRLPTPAGLQQARLGRQSLAGAARAKRCLARLNSHDLHPTNWLLSHFVTTEAVPFLRLLQGSQHRQARLLDLDLRAAQYHLALAQRQSTEGVEHLQQSLVAA